MILDKAFNSSAPHFISLFSFVQLHLGMPASGGSSGQKHPLNTKIVHAFSLGEQKASDKPEFLIYILVKLKYAY